MDKKAVISISLVFLVIFVFVIIAIVIGTFISSEKKNEFIFQMPTEIDYISNEALNLDFYFQELYDRTLLSLNPGSNSEDFVLKFKENIENYNPYTINKYKTEILNQLDSESVIFNETGYNLKINLLLKNNRNDETITVIYPYKRLFRKNAVESVN